jgi:Ca-activated chloride channel homolog
MNTPLDVEVTLGEPAVPAGEEPEEPVHARIRLNVRAEAARRPVLDLCFLLDASASMHRFVLDPDQRERWRQRAEQRGEVTRQQADGRTGMVWTGETLRELQKIVSTPMISTLRGVWRTLEALEPVDRVSVLAFADQQSVVYEDAGVAERPARLQPAKAALGRLGSGVDESGLGRGTRLTGALEHALSRLTGNESEPVLRRMILVSDGIIEDALTCRPLLDQAADRGLVISVIGVAEEFDEEFLMMAADLTRGNYYYAATAPEVEQAVRQELEIATQVVGRQGILRLFPENGTLVQDVYPYAPALSEFQMMWVENGGVRFRIGDLSAAQPAEFLVRLAPAGHGAGEIRLGRCTVEGFLPSSPDRFVAEAPVRLFYTDDAMLLQAQDDEVLDAVRRLEIYQEERRAAGAVARGDHQEATRHLRAATRMLRTVGADDLANEMDAAATETESGTKNLSRTKRVKAGTRKLGEKGTRKVAPKVQPPPADPGGTRQLT